MVQVVSLDDTDVNRKSTSSDAAHSHPKKPIETVAVVGNGLYVAIIAAALSRKFMRNNNMRIVAVQATAASKASLGESTLDAVHYFHRFLGLKEHQMMAVTKATYKLATRYRHWSMSREGDFFHAYSSYGSMIDAIAFQHHITKLTQSGKTLDLTAYSLPASLAKQGKFVKLQANASAPPFSYALHIDTSAYAKGMRDYATRLGVQFFESTIKTARTRRLSGPTQSTSEVLHSIELENNKTIEADLFIDCSDQGDLIEACFPTEYCDWGDSLPCDRFISYSGSRLDPAPAYTNMSLHNAGYRRSYSLQDKVIDEFYYSSAHLSDSQALQAVAKDANIYQQKPGCRRYFWSSNCVAMGNAAGSLDRLSASNFHLVQSAILRLMDLFPDSGVLSKGDYASRDEYNSLCMEEYQRIRDYHVAHFAIASNAATHSSSAFWQDYKTVSLPASLSHKFALFESCGRIPFYERETFSNDVWVSLLMGLGWQASAYDVLLDMAVDGDANSERALATIAGTIENICKNAQSHQHYLDVHCTGRH